MTEGDVMDSPGGGNQNEVSAELLDQLRDLVKSYQESGQFETAIYWSDKIVTLGGGADDVYRLGQCLLLTKQYHRAASLVMKNNLHLDHLGCCYVAAKAQFHVNEVQESLDIINHGIEELVASRKKDAENIRTRALISNMYLLKAQIEESREDRELAAKSFSEALKNDNTCVQALTSLTQHQMVTQEEESNLIQTVTSSLTTESDLGQLVSFLYKEGTKKYSDIKMIGTPVQSSSEENKWCELMRENSDVRVSELERLYNNCEYHSALKLSSTILKHDPYHPSCLPLHVALLVELEKTSDLFKVAHSLVDMFPEWRVAWYAVGCYYYSIGRQDPARRYLEKATKQEPTFGPAWLVFGHSFAAENEHDQAMAAYFKAYQQMPGCHLPSLYIGLEYSLTNNTNQARTFFNQALEIAPNDPFVLHELGVTEFSVGNYERAEKYFSDALLRVESVTRTGLSSSLSDKWESLLNNLGHTHRKLGNYAESIVYHKQALVLCPLNPSTYSALGYVQSLVGDLNNAVESFHKALGIRREDTFSTNMLTAVIEQLMNSVAPFPGFDDMNPRFQISHSSPTTCPDFNYEDESPAKSPSSSRDCEMMDQTM